MTTIKVRRGTATQWANANPVLADGERGYDNTNKIFKTGDGVTAWASLAAEGSGSYALLSHAHSAAEVTSGTLPLSRGGTGGTDAATARTSLGLGSLATVTPTGTGSASTFLRGDGAYAATPFAPNASNVDATKFRAWRKQLSRVRIGTAFADLFCCGDSTTRGTGASTLAQQYPSVLAGLMNTYYVPTALTWAFAINGNAIGVLPNDTRVSQAGSWGNSFGYWQLSTGASGTLTYQPSSAGGPASCDTVDIYVIEGGGNQGTIDVNVNGGASLGTITPGATLKVTKYTRTFSATSNPSINLVGSAVSSNALVVAMNAYLSTSPCVRVGNIGVGATTSAGWINTVAATGPNSYQYSASFQNFAPHLTIIDLGINDAGINNATAATYQANMTTLIGRAQQSGAGDVLLKSMAPSSGSPYTTLEPQYVAALPGLAAANSCGFLDTYSRLESYAVGNPLGYYSDGLHPSGFGYADIAQAVFNVLKTI